jgi:hypothetical protein
MACAWIGNRVLIVEQISYFLLSVMSVLLLCNNFSYIYSPTNAVDVVRKIHGRVSFCWSRNWLLIWSTVYVYINYIRLKSRIQYTTDGPTRNAMLPFVSVLLCLSKLAVPFADRIRKWKRRYRVLKEQMWFREPSGRSRVAKYLPLHKRWKWKLLSWEWQLMNFVPLMEYIAW